MIDFYHVSKRFDPYSTALNDVTFSVEKGEFVFLTGHSGAGKSTILKLVLRQLQPTDGHLVVNGRRQDAVCLGILESEYRKVALPRLNVMIKQAKLLGKKDAPSG